MTGVGRGGPTTTYRNSYGLLVLHNTVNLKHNAQFKRSSTPNKRKAPQICIETTLARRAKFSHALVWPLELGLRTPTLRCGHFSGLSHTRGRFFDFEVGGHDGACKGRVHVIVPFVRRKNGDLIDRQQSYNVLVLRVPGLEEGVMFGGKAL